MHAQISRTLAGTIALAACLGLPACANRPPLISHVVFVSLDDPARSQDLLDDADAMLRPIPGVATYAAGPHIDTGRATILSDYDIGLVIGFDSEADYSRYVTHPDHMGFVQKWKPTLTSLRVYDIHDPD